MAQGNAKAATLVTETRPPSQAGRFHWADNRLPCGIDSPGGVIRTGDYRWP